MWKGDNAVHIRWQRLAGETAFHQVDRMRSAIARRHHSDIIPRSYSSIVPYKPTKGSRVLSGYALGASTSNS